MKTILGWSIRKLGGSTILSGSMLLLALVNIALGLNSIVRGLDLALVVTITVLGFFTGWIIGKLRLRSWLALELAFGLGIGIVFWRVGQLGSKSMAFIQAAIELAVQVFNWRVLRPLPDARPVVELFNQLIAQVIVLAIRWRDWITGMASGAPAFDPVAAALMWSFLLWVIATWAAWQVRRHAHPFGALLPGIALLGAILAYVGGDPIYLIPVIGALLLLMVLQSATVRERRWQTSGIDYAEDIRFDLAVFGVLISLLLIGAASITPSISVAQIAHAVEHRLTQPGGQASRLSDSFGLVAPPKPPTIFDSIRMTGLPRRHLIGAGPELNKQTAMLVRVDPVASPPVRYYWRSNTYEKYIGSGWATDAGELIDYQAGEQTINELASTQRLIRQEIQIFGNGTGIVYAAGTLVSADHDFQVDWRSQADKDFFGASIPANSYQVESIVPTAGESELHSAGNNYPDWIRTRYLALPDDVSERVLTLARDLTATAPTPYDRARLIENYLRQFPYTTNLPTPPTNRDIVDYFLFDLKRGYCDYYASAMVVLARAAGLPTRLVIGYGTGTYDATTAQYRVTEADAHSWVEIYFPNYGWIEFEPTGGRDPLDRSEAALPALAKDREKPKQPLTSNFASNSSLGLLLSGGITVSLLALVIWVILNRIRLRWSKPVTAIDRIYRQLYRHAHRLGLPARSADTPDEIAAQLIERLEFTDAQKSKEEIGTLTAIYVRRRYSAHPIDTTAKRQAIQTWEHLNGRLWWVWLKQWSRRLIKKKLETRSQPLRESNRMV